MYCCFEVECCWFGFGVFLNLFCEVDLEGKEFMDGFWFEIVFVSCLCGVVEDVSFLCGVGDCVIVFCFVVGDVWYEGEVLC